MTHEDYVSFEQAKALKELGFDWEVVKGYSHFPGEKIKSCNFQEENVNKIYSKWCFAAPTLDQAQKWLRNVKKTYLLIDYEKWFTKPFSLEIYKEVGEKIIHKCYQNGFQTYEEAISAGIDKALEILKQQNNEKVNRNSQ